MQKLIKPRNTYRQLLEASIGALAVFSLAFVLIPTLISEASATTNLSAQVTWNAISLTFDPDVDATEEYESSSGASGSQIGDTGHGDIDFGSIIPTSKSGDNYGTMVITKKTLGVTTPGRYYSVYLSMSSSDQNLNYTYDGNTDTRMNIPATSGTWDAPITIISNGQTGWGYMVPETTITKSDGSTASVFSTLTRSGINTLFSGKLNTNLIAGTGEGGGGAAYSDSLWAAVPALSAPQQIWKNTTHGATGFSDGDDFDIYFAINVDTDTLSGEYKNQIVYTALASATNIDSVSENLIRSKALGGTGDTQTLIFDLTSNNSGFVAEDNIAIYLVPHTAMVAANYNPANFTSEQITTYTASNNQCIVTASSLAISDKAEISCTLPEKDPADMDKTTLSDSTYDFWLTIDNINATYVSKVDAGDAPSFVYAGLQSVDDDGDTYVTKMQEMTGGICKNTNMWGSGVGADARIYDNSGENNGAQLANSASSSAAVGLGTFDLVDTRDRKDYLVRRLADGNCWMVQNLDLDLADFAGTEDLTNKNTDINSRVYWDPGEKLRTKSQFFEESAAGSLSTELYQFQSRLFFGGSLRWYSYCVEGTGPLGGNGTACSEITAASNENVEFARSYSNGLAYITGSAKVKDEDRCINNEATVSDEGGSSCQMQGEAGNEDGIATQIEQSTDGLTIDETRRSSLITDADDETFTMRGSMYYGTYYNWFSATAESGKFNMGGSSYASDSICPKGWQLPNNADQDGKSFRQYFANVIEPALRYGEYAQSNRQAIVEAIKLPTSLNLPGYYNQSIGGLRRRGKSAYYHESGTNTYAQERLLFLRTDGYYTGADSKLGGFSIRCVARD